jgi:hypothetical protein
MQAIIFTGIHALLAFIYSLYVVPAFIQRGHIILSVILTLSTFLVLAYLNPVNFELIDRIWRGGLVGTIIEILGIGKYYLLKRLK